ncbi:MAG: Asp-tRNA(Asn)/Glu-tRNA(Gln) amidotransferase subunit GatB [bacterium]|nr:Asp-tRNA(Asn)/Glu-tRNA(Gln) amidotransferase subunit GatB [bacterium]
MYTPTIGLEVHVELKTRSKMFCSCKNDPLEKQPNVNICPVCMGHPGTLPVANEDAIKKVIQVGLALGCTIAERSKFDRKNYFYPDLPKGYQISQYDMPLCEKGKLLIGGKDIHITRIHMEEDTGRLLHGDKQDYSLVDFNRAGIPLMELVTEPDITSAAEARAFAQELQLILRYLGASDANMEQGEMRVEANVSVRKEGQEKLGTKVEVKNLNSFRSVEKAILFEAERQEELLEKGEKIAQETRGWNDAKEETVSQREKEEAHDYRYFPEPDIPPMRFSQDEIAMIQSRVPELPQQKRERFQNQYGLSQQEVEVLVVKKALGEYFENVVSELGKGDVPATQKEIQLAANYMLSDLSSLLNESSSEEIRITAEDFSELIVLIQKGTISSAIAKKVLAEMFATGKDPDHVIEDLGLSLISDQGEIERIAREVISKNPKALEDFKKGKENSLQFLLGQMMGASKGKVQPEIALEVLKKLLTESI